MFSVERTVENCEEKCPRTWSEYEIGPYKKCLKYIGQNYLIDAFDVCAEIKAKPPMPWSESQSAEYRAIFNGFFARFINLCFLNV